MAAFPPLFTGLNFLLVLFLKGPLFLEKDLCALLQIEFLVLHSFPFLGVCALMKWAGKPKESTNGVSEKFSFWGFCFWGLLIVYISASFTLGWRGPIFFLVATLATYTGFWLKRLEPFAVLHLGLRWFFSLMIYMISISTFKLSTNVDNWGVEGSTFKAGLMYFLCLGFLEYSGVYDIIELFLRKNMNKGSRGDN